MTCVHMEPVEAVLLEIDEQRPMMSVVLRLCHVRLEDAVSLLETALLEWLAGGAVPGKLIHYVGERCLKYSGETHASLAERMRIAGGWQEEARSVARLTPPA